MSSAAKQIFLSARLPGFSGRGDKYLGEIAQELRRVLWKAQNTVPEHPRPRMTLPPEFLNHDQGIGAFSNPDEGVEYSLRFNHVLSGLRKAGAGLTDEEADALRHLLTDAAISPAFVRRLVAEHGAESLAETFLVRKAPSELALEFLLRRHNGQFFRKRYPALSLLQEAAGPRAC